jgi:hypothetical protein
MPASLRLLVAVVAMLSPGVASSPAVAESRPPASGAGLLGHRISVIAVAEARNPRHNQERGANCNYYSAALQVSPRCANGWRRAAWCADFARWTWRRAGANAAGLSAWAISFHTYGVRHRTWRAGAALTGAQPGDVIGYRFGGTTSDDHVGVIIAVRPTLVVTVDGNVDNRTKFRTVLRNTRGVSGYTRPVS